MVTTESATILVTGIVGSTELSQAPLWLQDGHGGRVDMEAVGPLRNSIIEEPDSTVVE